MSIKAAARAGGSTVHTLARLNPALTPAVIAGRFLIPKGYRLRLPADSAANFNVRYARRRAKRRRRPPKQRAAVHHVKRGQTLCGIAKLHGTSVKALKRRNHLRSDHIRVGQSLIIPSS